MQRQVDWAKGKPDEFVMLEGVAEAAASAGQMQKAREVYRQAVESAQRGKFREIAAGHHRPLCDRMKPALETQRRRGEQALAALAMDRSRETLPFAGFALAMAGDTATGERDGR